MFPANTVLIGINTFRAASDRRNTVWINARPVRPFPSANG